MTSCGHLGEDEGDVARHGVDLCEVRDQAERRGHEAQVLADERLLHEHDVEAEALDLLTEAIGGLPTFEDARLGATIAGGGKARSADVRRGLLGETREQALHVAQLPCELDSGSHIS